MLTIEEIQKATQGQILQGNPLSKINAVYINSKLVRPGSLFIAIKGKNFDGHDFIKEAIEKKVKAVIVSKKEIYRNSKLAIIYVKDTVKALGEVARAYREKFNIPVIAITGSAGKTTTKEMVATVLQTRYKVLKNVATENNQIGVPLTLFKLRKSHQLAVLELGTNRFGDIRWLTYITKPTHAIFTNIGESHLELLKNKRGVFKEKCDLIRYMLKRGTVIFNRDDQYLRKILKMSKEKKIISYGINNKADYKADDIILMNSQMNFSINKKYKFSIKTFAVHNVYNALAAISCSRCFKINYYKIINILRKFTPLQGRQNIERIGKYLIIDDSYNANPVSFRSAVSAFVNMKIKGKKILICADMLELGKHSKGLHTAIGELIAKTNLNCVLTFGRQAKYISSRIEELNRDIQTLHFMTLKSLQQRLLPLCEPDDAILIKGSRGMHLEKIADFLKKELVR